MNGKSSFCKNFSDDTYSCNEKQIMREIISSHLPISSVLFSSGVFSVSTAVTSSAILPTLSSSLWMWQLPSPYHRSLWCLWKPYFFYRWRALLLSMAWYLSLLDRFSVRGASSHLKEWFSTSLASAGILSPASRSKISRNELFEGTSSSLPPRRAVIVGESIFFNASKARSARIFLNKSKNCTENDDDSNDHCINYFTLLRVNQIGYHRKHDRNEKDDDEDVFELIDEEGEGGNLFFLFQFIIAIFFKSSFDLPFA